MLLRVAQRYLENGMRIISDDALLDVKLIEGGRIDASSFDDHH